MIGDPEQLRGARSQCTAPARARSPEPTLNLIRNFVSWFVKNLKKLAGKTFMFKRRLELLWGTSG